MATLRGDITIPVASAPCAASANSPANSRIGHSHLTVGKLSHWVLNWDLRLGTSGSGLGGGRQRWRTP